MRVVIDTNCVVSALLFRHGQLDWLRVAWSKDDLVPLVSKDTVGELLRVLAYPKFRLDAGAREDLLAEFLPYAEAVDIPQPPPPTPPLRDIGDRPFIELALAGNAAALITGDRELRDAMVGLAVPALSPADLRASMGRSG